MAGKTRKWHQRLLQLDSTERRKGFLTIGLDLVKGSLAEIGHLAVVQDDGEPAASTAQTELSHRAFGTNQVRAGSISVWKVGDDHAITNENALLRLGHEADWGVEVWWECSDEWNRRLMKARIITDSTT